MGDLVLLVPGHLVLVLAPGLLGVPELPLQRCRGVGGTGFKFSGPKLQDVSKNNSSVEKELVFHFENSEFVAA